MSKLSFKCFLESEEYSMNEGIKEFFLGSKKSDKKDESSEFITNEDGVFVLDKDKNKVKKAGLSPQAIKSQIARFNAALRDQKKTDPRTERQANDALTDTIEANKKAKAALDPKTRSYS